MDVLKRGVPSLLAILLGLVGLLFASVVFASSTASLSGSLVDVTGFATSVAAPLEPLADELVSAATLFGEQTGIVAAVQEQGMVPPVKSSSGMRIALVVGAGGLRVVNVTDPASPAVVGAYKLPEGEVIRSVELRGSTAYVAGQGKFLVLDISAPSNPSLLGQLALDGDAYGLDVDGNYAYIATLDGLIVVNISSLSSLRIVNSYTGCPANRDVEIVGSQYAFLSCNKEDSELRALNVANPANITFLARGYSFGNTPVGLAISSGKSYLAVSEGYIAVHDVSAPSGLPSAPLENRYPSPATYNSRGIPQDVAVLSASGLAYVAAGSRIEVFDISSAPSNASLRASLTINGFARSILVDGGYAYVAGDWAGLLVLNASDAGFKVVGQQQESLFSGWDVALLTLDADETSSSVQASGTCGDGLCNGAEGVATCFVDCATEQTGLSCSGILPLVSSSSSSSSSSSLSSAEGEYASDLAQDSSSSVQASVQASVEYLLSQNLRDEAAVVEEGVAQVSASVSVLPQFTSGAYIVEFKGEPQLKVASVWDARIKNMELEVKKLEEELASASSAPAPIRPLLRSVRGQRFNAKKAELEALNVTKGVRLAEHRAELAREHEVFVQDVERTLGPRSKDAMVARYSQAFNGVLMRVSSEQAASLRALPQVKQVTAERIRAIDLTTSVGYINADSVWNLPGLNGTKLTGAGTTIAIIDTGVDYTHPDLGGCFGTGTVTAAAPTAAAPTAAAPTAAAPTAAASSVTGGSKTAAEDALFLSSQDASFLVQTEQLEKKSVAYVVSENGSFLFADNLAGAPAAPAAPSLSEESAINGMQLSRIATVNRAWDILAKPSGIDMDKDGKREFIIRRNVGDVWTSIFDVYEYNAGSFSVVKTLQVPNSSSYYVGDADHDSDGDGRQEVAIFGRTENNFSNRIYESSNLSSYLGTVSWELPGGGWTVGMQIEDMDADGHSDVVIAGQNFNYESRIAVYENTGNDAYVQRYYEAFPDIHTSQSAVVMDDLDGDGRKEIIYGGLIAKSSKLYMVENTENNSYQQVWSSEVRAWDNLSVNLNHVVFAGDLDGDGRKEFIAGGVKTEPQFVGTYLRLFYVFEATGDNAFERVANLSVYAGIWDSEAVNVADLDADGRKEVVISAGNSVKVFESAGDNRFNLEWSSTDAYNSPVLGVGDHNGNGLQELLFVESAGTALYEYGSPAGAVCGNGVCEASENSSICPVDCPSSPLPPSGECKVIGGYDFLNNDANPMDDHGHGTHVAATAAGNGVLKGVAPDAKIYAYKVCTSAGSCPESAIIAAIERATDPNQDGDLSDRVDVISISLGGGGTPDDPDARAVDAAFDSGVFVSVSAGNSGPGSQTVGCPACARKATAVAAWCKPEHVGVDSRCPSPIASFSSRGPVVWSGGTLDKPDIAAPGVNICAAQWANAWSSSQCIDADHVSISGTSMAAPHLSGVAALLKQAHPDWTPQQIKDTLMGNAVDLGLDKYVQGAGLVDALAAVNVTATLPQASLDTAGKVQGIVAITGTAAGVNFTEYILEYSADAISWTRISRSSTPQVSSVLGSWDTGSLSDKAYTLRLIVRNSLGEQNIRTRQVVVDNVALIFPLNGTWTGKQPPLNIIGTILGNNFRTYRLEVGSSQGWTTVGISVTGNRTGILGMWNPQNVSSSGSYPLRLVAEFSDGRVEIEPVSVFVDTTLRAGFPVAAGSELRGSPTAVDLDNDGAKELIVGSFDGKVYAFHQDGRPVAGWPVTIGTFIQDTPVVADIDNDGFMEVIVSSNKYYQFHAFNHDGTPLAGWPVYILYYATGSPALGDLDADGDLEVVVGTIGNRVYAFHHTGQPVAGWPRSFTSYPRETPALADLDNDSRLEVLVLVNSSLHVLKSDGSPFPGFPVPVALPGRASPAVGDLDGNGDLEIVVDGNTWLHAFHHTGQPVAGWPKDIRVSITGSPALADIDDDSRLEVIAGAQSKVYAFNDDGSAVSGWPKTTEGNVFVIGPRRFSSPAIADIDNDNRAEIIIGSGLGSFTAGAKLYAWNGDGSVVSGAGGWPKQLPYIPAAQVNIIYPSPLIEDLDGDGRLEVAVGYIDGRLYVWNFPDTFDPATLQWNQFGHDVRNSGLYMRNFYVAPSVERYSYYTLQDNDCSVNITLSSSRNTSLAARFVPNVCDGQWDALGNGSLVRFQRNGLSQGSYAVKVSGSGAYSLAVDSFCRQDITPPLLGSSTAVPAFLSRPLLLSFSVSDSKGIAGCQACIASDGMCDTSEWSAAASAFAAGATQGVCSFLWNVSSGYPDGEYSVAFRVNDTSGNVATSALQHTTLDRTAPLIHALTLPEAVQIGSLVPFLANVTDGAAGSGSGSGSGSGAGVLAVNASLANRFVSAARSNISGLYEGSIAAPSGSGSFLFGLNVTDKAGNSRVLSRTVFVDEPVTWSPALPVLPNASLQPPVADAALGSAIHLVWEEEGKVYYSQLSQDAQFLLFAKLLSTVPYNAKSPSVSSVGAGVDIAWQDDRDGNKEIYYFGADSLPALVDGRQAVRITFNEFDSSNPQIISDPLISGAHLFWLDNREGSPEGSTAGSPEGSPAGSSDLFYASISREGMKRTSDSKLAEQVESYHVSSDGKALAWISQGSLYYAQLRNVSLTYQQLISRTTVRDEFALASRSANASYLVHSSSSNLTLHVLGNGTVAGSLLLSLLPSTRTPHVGLTSSGVEILWTEQGGAVNGSSEAQVRYARVNLAGNAFLVAPRTLFTGASQIRALGGLGSQSVALISAQDGLRLLSTGSVEAIRPSVQVSSLPGADFALVEVQASEPSHITISYATGSEAARATVQVQSPLRNASHTLVLSGLQPSSAYRVDVLATDSAGNTGSWSGTVTTTQQRNRPALPTTFFGIIAEQNGSVLGGVPVQARWTDANDVPQVTETVSLTGQQAAALNRSELTGYYLFNRANVNAKQGTLIRLSVPDMVNNVSLVAQPGNLAVNVTPVIVVDKTAPFLNVVEPVHQAVYATPFLTLRYTANEPLVSASFSLNGQDPVLVTGLFEINITGRLGANTLSISGTDRMGLASRTDISFMVEDRVPPVVRANQVRYVRSLTILSANISDTTNALSACEICIGGQEGCSWEPSGNTFRPGDMQGMCLYQWDTRAMADGNYTVFFRAVDTAGNAGTSLPFVVTVDNTAPPSLTPTVTPLSKEKKLRVQWTPSADPAFEKYVLYRSHSPAELIAVITNRSQVSYEDNAVESGDTYGYALVVVDSAGNEGAQVFSQAQVADVIAPSLSIAEPRAAGIHTYTSQTVALEYSGSEPLSWCGYRLQGGPLLPASASLSAQEGANSLALYCNDTAGNQGNATVTFVVDTIAPSSLVVSVLPVQGANQLRVAWSRANASDFAGYLVYRSASPFASVANATLLSRILGQETLSYTDTVGLASGQTYHYAVTAVDRVGNEQRTVSSSSGTVADTVPPLVTLLSPLPAKRYEGTLLPLTFVGSEPLVNCSYVLNGAAPLAIAGGNATIAVKEGSNALSLSCRDAAQNTGSASLSFEVDSSTPAPLLLLSVSALPGQNALRLSWQQSSAADFGQYAIYRSTSSFTSTGSAIRIATTVASSSPSSTSYTDSAGLESQSTYHYAVTAVDVFGNENASVRSLSGTVADTKAPLPLSLVASPVAREAKVSLSWSRSEDSDFAGYTLYRSVAPFSSVAGVSAIATFTRKTETSYVDSAVISDTTYYYAVTAKDASGNENPAVPAVSSQAVTVYDMTPPVLSLIEPLNRTYTSRNVSLHLRSNEPSNCTYSLNGALAQPVPVSVLGESYPLAAGEGGNALSIACQDENANSASASVRFSVDSEVPPAVRIRNITATPKTGRLTVFWEPAPASAGLVQYNIYRQSGNFSQVASWFLVHTAPANESSYVRDGLISEQTYYHAVTAVDAAGNENMTAVGVPATVADINPPRPVYVAGVNAIERTSSLQVLWDASPEPDVVRYEVYRALVPFSAIDGLVAIANVSVGNTSYLDTGLASQTVYWYGVAAVDSEGNRDNRVLVLQGITSDLTAPRISLLSPVNTTYASRSVALQFSADEPVTCFASLNALQEQPVSSPSALAAFEGANILRLRCEDSSGNNGTANVSFLTDTLPPASLAVTLSQVPRAQQIVVSWPASAESDFASYTLYKGTAPFAASASAQVLSVIPNRSATSFIDSAVESQRTYYYAVAAADHLGNQNLSMNASSITVEDLVPPQITLTSPLSGATYASSAVALRHSANEPLAGCVHYLNGFFMGSSSGSEGNVAGQEGSNLVTVSCTDLNNNTANVSVAFSVNALPPAPVSNVRLSWGSVVLNWIANAESDVSYYAIYRSQSSFADASEAILIATTTGSTYRDTSVEGETLYYYGVTAVDTAGNENTTLPEVFSILTPDITPPAPIAGLVVEPVSGQPQLLLSWQPSSAPDLHKYALYRSSSPFVTTVAAAAGSVTRIAFVDKNTTSYRDEGLQSGQTLHYAVAALDYSGNENPSVVSVSGTVADFASPVVATQQVASPLAGQVTLRAVVSDEQSLAQSCEVCVVEQAQQECAAEHWVTAVSAFGPGSVNGTCAFTWNAPSVAATYAYTFRVNDSAGNQGVGQRLFFEVLDVSVPVSVDIPLSAGWNLISLPVVPSDNRVGSVLAPLEYTRIFHYDAFTKGWFSHFAQDSIFNPAQTLTELEVGKAYWIEVPQAASLTVTGSRIPAYTSQLQQGWNLVGHPYEVPLESAQALRSLEGSYVAIFAYNATGERWERYSAYPSIAQPNTLAYLQPGAGYMIDMTQDALWSPQR